MPAPHVQVILGCDAVPEPLKSALRRSGATASFRPLTEVLRSGLTPTADAVVVVAPEDSRGVQGDLRVLFDRMADRPRATLVMKAAGTSMPRLTHPPSVPVTFGGGMSEEELCIRLSTMLEMRRSLDTLHREAQQSGRSDAAAARQYAGQLRLASQVQRGLLPEPPPAFGPISFATIYRPAELVSGDLYDIQRLDETHIGIAVADATGTGIPAALLTVFVRRALRGKLIEGGGHRILRPDEVLARLNGELLEANLSECRYVAACYAVLDTATLQLEIARAGAPYPLHCRAGGELELLRPEGGVLGVMPQMRCAVHRTQLAPGDALILHTDGLERIIVPQLGTQALASAFRNAALAAGGAAHRPRRNTVPDESTRTRGPRLVDAEEDGEPPHAAPPGSSGTADALLAAAWVATLRDEGVDAAFDQLLVRHDALRRIGHALDDLTLIAVKVDPAAQPATAS